MKKRKMSHSDHKKERKFGTQVNDYSKKTLFCVYIVCLLIAIVLVEWVPALGFMKEISIWHILVTGIIPSLLSLVSSKIQKNMPFIDIIKDMKKVFVFSICIVVLLFGIKTFAKMGLTGRVLYAFGGAIENFMSYDQENADMFEQNDLTTEQKKWVEGHDESLVSIAKKSEVPENETTVVKNLSQEDQNKIFFLDIVTNWEEQELIDAEVYSWVKKQRGNQWPNKFDKSSEQGGAPSKLQAEISKVSEEEINAKFVQRKSILETRSNAYVQYPKYSLSNLIANDNHALALALFYYGGQDSTVMYYYGQSVLYSMDGLAYAGVSRETFKEKLTIIQQRYRDIVFTCGKCEEVKYAEKLADAFQYVADQF